jgi:hypothetical protein
MVEYNAAITGLQSKNAAAGLAPVGDMKQTLFTLEAAFLDSLDREEEADEVAYSGYDYANIYYEF